MIDMRSDTVTRPTAAMRKAMAEAEVGDDVYGDDPTVAALERRTAEILGKEAAVFMPSGTMSNQVAIRTHTEPGDEVLMDAATHTYRAESGGPAALSGVMIRHLPGRNGVFTASDVLDAVREPHGFEVDTVTARPRLVWVENTHNGAGGTIWPVEAIREVADAARSRGLRLHLDGARLWHAAAATGTSEAEYATPADSVNVCFSKGLGAPVGSALAGGTEFIARARRFRQMFGGGMRQAGIVAAGALHALEHHRGRLAEDHEKARELAEGLAELAGIEIDPSLVQTNIVRFRTTSLPAGEFVDRCHAGGLHLLPGGPDRVRAILHMDVSPEDVGKALEVIRKALGA